MKEPFISFSNFYTLVSSPYRTLALAIRAEVVRLGNQCQLNITHDTAASSNYYSVAFYCPFKAYLLEKNLHFLYIFFFFYQDLYRLSTEPRIITEQGFWTCC